MIKWVLAQKQVLDKEFAQVGVSPNPKDPLVLPYSPTSYATFATGRENIQSLTCDFDLIGRHNLITLAFEYILGFFFSVPAPEDVIKIEIVPNAKILPFVFAIVNKNHMQSAREKNYFLSLTRTADSDKLPSSFVFMTESNELTQLLFSEDLSSAVHRSQSFLRLFAIADQKKEKPTTVQDITFGKPSLTLTLDFPKTDEELEACKALLQATISFVDSAVNYSASSAIRPELQRKIKAVRDSEMRKIQKVAEQERADELAKKKAEEKREQRSKISKLSPKEQLKIEQKEREKEMRKMRQKQSKRM